MREKIFRAMLFIAVLVLALSSVISTSYLHSRYNAERGEEVSAELELAAEAVNAMGTDYFEGMEDDTFRFTVVGADGTVLFDTRADPASMGSHADRQEICQALATGYGSSARYSATLTEKTVYRAVKLDDGSVLRVSTSQMSVGGAILNVLPMNVLIALVAIVAAYVFSTGIAVKLTEPLLTLDLDHPTENDAYEELAPVLAKIHRQHRQIRQQVDALRHKNEEFAQIISSMSEGLVLLDSRERVIAMNRSARAIFPGAEEPEGMDFLLLDRTPELSRAITGRGHTEVVLPRDGRQYRFTVSTIETDGQPVGTLILAIDITEKALAEQNRREFTANVSHELKTPLQSILGSAELLDSGLARGEDAPRFVGNIKKEAARLVALIDDIIRLSQLDERTELPREGVALDQVAREVAQQLAPAAGQRQVALELCCDPVRLEGVRRYVHEILYNLCDNAIRYNKAGGRVELRVWEEDGRGAVSVTDTGIGIPPEHRERVFERFYRVDKSHSRETGGTGLGLSIVKHAAQALDARVELESTPGEGTRITVYF